ncbi:unnamed protein product [Mytilus edulis]|uniref:Uncharacterized protein n=1 Tax=Mytilus edulis TaxID=6550 RepID=A0A8S3Q6I5_MYTED|nr:unnamed protein product [Mytilus edulis]
MTKTSKLKCKSGDFFKAHISPEILCNRDLVLSNFREDVTVDRILAYLFDPIPSALFHDDGTMWKYSKPSLVVGLVFGGLLLVCVVIVIVVLIRRQTFVSGTRDKVRNILRENDYNGCQDVALPHTGDHSGHTQLADQQTSNDDEYTIGNLLGETSFNDIIDDRNRSAGSSIILDPKNTGFNRTISDTPTGYEFAQSVSDTRGNFSADDQYAISEEGVYDHSRNNRHKESEDNIYNHAVDTVYDSGSHKRYHKGTEDTYDHFFGQKQKMIMMFQQRHELMYYSICMHIL